MLYILMYYSLDIFLEIVISTFHGFQVEQRWYLFLVSPSMKLPWLNKEFLSYPILSYPILSYPILNLTQGSVGSCTCPETVRTESSEAFHTHTFSPTNFWRPQPTNDLRHWIVTSNFNDTSLSWVWKILMKHPWRILTNVNKRKTWTTKSRELTNYVNNPTTSPSKAS